MRAATEAEGGGTASVADGLLITGSSAAGRTTVEALRLENGLPAWWFDSRMRFHDLVCRDGVAFVASSGRGRPGRFGSAAVVALRAADGTRLWHMGPAQIRRRLAKIRIGWWFRALWQTSSPSTARRSARSLALAGPTYLAVCDNVVLASSASIIFAFDVRSGALRWCLPMLFGGDRRLIAAQGSMVYINGSRSDYRSGAVDALDARTGKVRWSGERGFDAISPVADDTRVYCIGSSARGRAILALRVADGTCEQTFSLANEERLAGLTDEGIAFLLQHSQLRAVRIADGAELWQAAPLRNVPDYGKASSASPVHVVADGPVVFYGYVCDGDQPRPVVVGALDAQTGATRWEWHTPERPSGTHGGNPRLFAAGGNVYVIVPPGIFALRGTDGQLLWQAPSGTGVDRAALCFGARSSPET